MRGYDRWKLQSPYEGPELPSYVENLLDRRVEVPDVGWGIVSAAFPEDDEDEDGKHRIWIFEISLVEGGVVELTEMELEEALNEA